MRRVLAPLGGAISFIAVALLVIGGLTWVTIESLHVESEQRLATARADASQNERLALWRLDGRLFPAWGVENYRPYAHYFAFYSPCPVVLVDKFGVPEEPVRVPSPLLTADLPDWMKLHFQLDPQFGWESPQVMSNDGETKLRGQLMELFQLTPENVNGARSQALHELRTKFPAKLMHEQLMSLELDLEGSPLAVPFYDRDKQSAVNQNTVQPEVTGMANPPPAGNEKETLGRRGGFAGGGFGAGMAGAKADGAAKLEGPPAPAAAAPAPPAAKVNPSVVANVTRGTAPAQTGNGYEARSTVGRNGLNDMGSSREGSIAKPEKKDEAERKLQEQNKPTDKSKDASPEKQGAAKGAAAPQGGESKPGEVRRKSEDDAKPEELQKARKDEAAKQNLDRVAGADFKLGTALRAEAKKAPIPMVRPPIVQLGPMRPVWLKAPNGETALLLVRAARLETKTVFQGVLLDWPRLQNVLLEEVRPQLPEAKLEPVMDAAEPTERRMTALPASLDPGPEPAPPPAGWTPLRIGLTLGWVAALLALAAVGFVGWTLIDLSERRIRFVSAVTHELRTPLTSLRLYLDLLSSGMIREEEQQREYLRTLGTESERLNRLIDNVLDFAKLEKNTVAAQRVPMPLNDLLEQVKQTWADRLSSEGRELIVMSTLPPEQSLSTDARIATQILGNLIDNARKYSCDAEEKRIWLWARPGEKNRIVLEVEDRGPGVPAAETATIFRPFRRGANVHSTGGAGLGLALARQWADLLGGTLSYRPADGGVGACFRLSLPAFC